MDTKNLNDLIQSIRSLGVSEEFVLGTLFTLGATLMRNGPSDAQEDIARGFHWVMPGDLTVVGEEIFERMNEGPLKEVVEEYFFRMEWDIPVRDIELGEVVLHVFNPKDHGIFSATDRGDRTMAGISRLYFAAVEEFGRRLKKSEFSNAEAYIAGISFFHMQSQMDTQATGFILQMLYRSAPPALRFIFALPRISGAQGVGWLPTQMALWGLVTGLDDKFMGIAWPYQSWVLFKDKKPIPGVEDLSPSEFFSHCYEISKFFAAKNVYQIGQVADLGVGPDDVPEFTGTGSEREEIFALIDRVWGYDPANNELSAIEQKQVNGCITFILFCSLCRAYRAGHRFDFPQASSEDHKITMLQTFPTVLSLDDFLMAAEEKLEAYPRFSLAAALATSQGREFKFFVSMEKLDPFATEKLLRNLVLATRSSEIYILYFADLSQFFQEDLGPFQSIAFRVDNKGSAPYWFCRMVPERDTWRVRPFSLMNEHDRNGSLFLSDFSSAFQTHSEHDVASDRQQLEDWKPENDWNWVQYDR